MLQIWCKIFPALNDFTKLRAFCRTLYSKFENKPWFTQMYLCKLFISTTRLTLGHPSVSRRLIAIASTRSFAMRVFLVCYVGPSCLVQCTYESLSLAILASSPPFLSQLGNPPTAPYVLTSQLVLAIVSLGTGSKYFEDKCLNLGTFFCQVCRFN